MMLDEFFDYKERLMEDILSVDKIVDLLKSESDISDPHEFMYTQVFPFEYIPETVEVAKTFICCDVDIQKVYSKTYLSPVMLIWVFTHKSLLRLPEGGVRTDKLCSEIADAICGSRHYGLGELELYSVKRFAPINYYQGKVMTFEATDFNRVPMTNKPVPSNRKSGI